MLYDYKSPRLVEWGETSGFGLRILYGHDSMYKGFSGIYGKDSSIR